MLNKKLHLGVLQRVIIQHWMMILLAMSAVALRFIDLDLKPAHFDEGINGWFVSGIWDKGFYNYDPTNFHGPLYFYFLQFTEALFGQSVAAYRFANGILSCLIIYLALSLNFFRARAGWFAGMIFATSTGYVFYSRYAIHETFFVLFLVLFFVGYLQWRTQRSSRSLLKMVIGVYGAILNKETFFIFFGTLFIAEVCLKIFKKFVPERDFCQPSPQDLTTPSQSQIFYYWFLGLAFTLWVFSGFGMDPQSVGDAFQALAVWTKTGTETGHAKPLYYWLEIGLLYEPFLLLSLLSLILPILYGDYIWRLTALVGFGLFLAYTIIPYKTPWLVLAFAWPLYFHMGFCLSWAFEQKAWIKRVFVGWFVLGLGYQVYTSVKLNWVNYENPKEKYVYVQTRDPIYRFLDWFQAQALERPSLYNLKVNLGIKDNWPLPWLLEVFTQVSYTKKINPAVLQKDILFIDEDDFSKLVDAMYGEYFYWRGPLRDSMANVAVFVKAEHFPQGIPGFKKFKRDGEVL